MKKLYAEIPYLKGDRIVIKRIGQEDAGALAEMVSDPLVYRYVPAFLFEKKYDDINYMISRLYDECLEDSLILGIYDKEGFCGLAELYGYREDLHKISLGCRLIQRAWHKGIAAEATDLLIDHVFNEKNLEIITASSMTVNKPAGRVLERCGFSLVISGAEEDWGFKQPTVTDKWIR
ncbi:MAG: GNAT family N-acetyltransferase [Lachnospiraceae bacterium]|nr:GNAT family N-acetyltransferase [Lachnospiraceae bacterium]